MDLTPEQKKLIGPVNSDDIRLCNCAGCGKTLVALADILKASCLEDKDKLRLGIIDMQTIYGSIYGRPYCSRCLSSKRVK